jgi:hypothetical protein
MLQLINQPLLSIHAENNLPEPNWPNSNGELFYGWAGELTYPNTIGFDRHFQLYRDIVEWLENNVKDHYHNTCWTKIGDCIYVQFRKQKDMMWFSLRFGA